MKKSVLFLSIIISIIASSCKDNKEVETKKAPERKKPAMSYHMENAKQWLDANAADSAKVRIALALNRTDKAFFPKMDSVVIADDMNGDLSYYLPFPLEVPYLKDINKIIFFSYPAQTFATYEKGSLTYTGPTNMGRKKDPTPTGLFYTNWKAEETISTFDDEWKLRWNFNIENKLGVGWHQYELPGYPASHSCLRLQEKDARYLYDWADQWVLADKDSVQVKGTPVIVFGSYDFGGPKPWLQLITNPRALDISPDEIQKQTQPFLNAILSEQKNRAKHQAAKSE
jgi:lipoprotein-anchoring transpeptidase ErfK/SrfK